MNNLASKLLLTLFPPNVPCFRLTIDAADIEEIISQAESLNPGAGEQIAIEIDKSLNDLEDVAMDQFEQKPFRVKLFHGLKLAIVTGNALIRMTKDHTLVVHRLDKFVVQRDNEGNLLEIVLKEEVSPLTLPPDLRARVYSQHKGDHSELKKVALYTGVKLEDDGKWHEKQELLDELVEGSEGSYTQKNFPWIALRWNAIDGEDYGRGIVEEYLGDLRSAEGLSKAITQAATAASRVVFLVDPNGTTFVRELAKTPNGGFCRGREQDITALKLDKQGDFSTADAMLQRLEKRLSQAFLMVSSVTRNAERVTAEEIKLLASELDDGLGGNYSVLTQDLVLPIVRLNLIDLEKAHKIPHLGDSITPVIVTGLDALGRGHEYAKLMSFLGEIGQAIPGAESCIDPLKACTKAATSQGIDPDEVLKTREQMQAEMQQAQQAQMMQAAGPGVAQEITKGMVGQAAQGGQPS